MEFLLCGLVEPRLHIRLHTLTPDRLFGEAQAEAGRIRGKPEELSERTEFHEYVCVFVEHEPVPIRHADASVFL